MAVITFLLALLATLSAIPGYILLAQVISSLRVGTEADERSGLAPRFAVLIPAHDEESGILATLAAAAQQLSAADRILVVADNCTDDTAAVARAFGATVAERFDPAFRGKGYALDFGLRALRDDPPEVVIVLDADCLVGPMALERIASLAHRLGSPVQASYEMSPPAMSGVRDRISAFAWRVRNWSRPLGMHRWGFPCQLMGSGMAFPWKLISSIELATGHLAEDMQMGLDLCRLGHAPVFCPSATVASRFPEDGEGARIQKTRWEHGHLAMIAGTVPRLFVQSLSQLNGNLALMALDLCVPPLSLQILISCVVTLAMLPIAILTHHFAGLAIAGSGLASLALAVAAAWFAHGRMIVSFQDLLRSIGYIAWKIPVYLKLVSSRQIEWIRTKRGAGR
jgi:cellulose synthase/poly-beta-1,6-N-acetylglucosamine synthase-like glycosyltransferase